MAKLRPRLDGRRGGGCLIIVFGIRRIAGVEGLNALMGSLTERLVMKLKGLEGS